jgi:hypothetical protein
MVAIRLAEPARVPTFSARDPSEETEMKFALIGAAAVVAMASATPALAQAVVEDPGYCAQFYPNANCQNVGPGNRYTDGGYYRDNWQHSKAYMERHVRHHHATHRR